MKICLVFTPYHPVPAQSMANRMWYAENGHWDRLDAKSLAEQNATLEPAYYDSLAEAMAQLDFCKPKMADGDTVGFQYVDDSEW